jgi:hypothetical protein
MVALYAAIAAVGLALWLVGYFIVANEVVYDQQESGITLAVLGTVLSVAGGASFLLTGRRAVSQRRVAVLGLVPAATAKTIAASSVSTFLVAGVGLAKYHRTDCPMAAGRDWPIADAVEHELAGCKPCGVCRP